MIALLPDFLIATLVQSLPALVALIAWSEAGSRILRQFGTRMLWELSVLVAIGVAFLLYISLRIITEDGANLAVIATAAVCAVAVVTAVTQRFRPESAVLRLTALSLVSVVAVQAGVMLGIAVYMVFWQPTR